MESLGCCGLIEPDLLGVVRELRGEGLLGRAGALLLEDGHDLRLDLGQGPRVGGLFIFNLEDVIAELCLDYVGGLAGRERECCLVELGNSFATVEPSEFPALRFAARVIGVLAGELGEVCRRP